MAFFVVTRMLTSLSHGDNVKSLHDRGKAVSLYRGRHSILAELDVLKHDGMKPGMFKLSRGIRDYLL